MHRYIRLLLTALAATAALATAVNTATAGRFSISNQQFRVVWSSLELENSITTNVVRCAVTLEGSFHSRTIPKTRGLLVGYLTKASVQNNQCTGGRATVGQETLPWHMTYNSFTGTLPAIRTVTFNLIRAGLIIEVPGVASCKSISSTENPDRSIANIGTGGRIDSLSGDPTARIPFTNGPGGFLCGLGSGFYRGDGALTVLGTTSSVSITLI